MQNIMDKSSQNRDECSLGVDSIIKALKEFSDITQTHDQVDENAVVNMSNNIDLSKQKPQSCHKPDSKEEVNVPQSKQNQTQPRQQQQHDTESQKLPLQQMAQPDSQSDGSSCPVQKKPIFNEVQGSEKTKQSEKAKLVEQRKKFSLDALRNFRDNVNLFMYDSQALTMRIEQKELPENEEVNVPQSKQNQTQPRRWQQHDAESYKFPLRQKALPYQSEGSSRPVKKKIYFNKVFQGTTTLIPLTYEETKDAFRKFSDNFELSMKYIQALSNSLQTMNFKQQE